MIDINLIKKLRKITGVGILDCNKILIKSNGNLDIAIDNIRKLGHIKAFKKQHKILTEGVILAKISEDYKYGVIIELNCETDFVTMNTNFKNFSNKLIDTSINRLKNKLLVNLEFLRNKFKIDILFLISKFGENINIKRVSVLKGDILGFYVHNFRIGSIVSINGGNKKLANHIAMHIVANDPKYIKSDNIPKNILNNEYDIQYSIALKSIKSEFVLSKIVDGRMSKFKKDIVLLKQNFVLDSNKTVGDFLKENNIIINNFIRFELGQKLI